MSADKALREHIRARFTPRRAAHIFACADTAAALAARYGEDPDRAGLAGLLHDITREETAAEQLKLCEKYDILLDVVERAAPMLLHARTGAAVAAAEYGADAAVCTAIRYHTTGRAGMSRLEKILWLSDYIEPNRAYPDTQAVRALAARNLDGALLLALDSSIRHLIRIKGLLHPDTVHARNDLLLRGVRAAGDAILEDTGNL